MKTKLFGVYEPIEIIHRLLQETAPLDGPSGYSVTIKYVADNATEPPVIFFEIYEGANRCVFDAYFDQSTTLDAFEKKLYSMRPFGLRRCVGLCCEAIKNKTSFDVEFRKAAQAKDDNEEDLF